MKKISLITLHSVQNYGSALQTYASQTLFERLGCSVEIVDYVRENNLKENLVDTCLKNSSFWNKNFITRLIFRTLKEKDLKYRYSIFNDFLSQYIHLTNHRYIDERDFDEFPIDADIYCTGSDQTWNSYWNRGILEPFFLSFAKKNAPKIAYAASFGKKQLDLDEKNEIYKRLRDYTAITVRENEAVDILNDIGINGKRVLDPTVMINGDEWRNFSSGESVPKNEYVLIYQLNHNKEFNRIVKDFCKYKRLKCIRIGFGNEAYFYGGTVIKNPTVKEFVALISHARYIITDSFHATSFAANLNVQFFSWLPKKFSGRITDFLNSIGLNSRIFNGLEDLKAHADENIDYDYVNNILDNERKNSLNAVNNMLNQEAVK